MIEHTFEKQECSSCHKNDYCILWTHKHKRTTKTAFYCQTCFGWLPIPAQTKDDMITQYKELGMDDLEHANQPYPDIRDLD